MGLWAKSIVIFNAIREYGKQSIRSLADRTRLSKSSVHRHLQAMDRRDRYPESSCWETPAGRAWLIRLVVATLLVFGLKRGVGAETLSEFFSRLRLEGHGDAHPAPCEASSTPWNASSWTPLRRGRRRGSLMARYDRSWGRWMKRSSNA